MDDANPPFGQTHGELPTAQRGFGHGGSWALEGSSASVDGPEGTTEAACRPGRANLERDAVHPAHVARKAMWRVRVDRRFGAGGPSACRRQSERSGTLRGNKAHGWIGCTASETAAVHYGLVSGVKPCSWAVSSPTSSSRHLETGGAGARRGKPIPGGVLLAARHCTPEASISQPGLVFRHLRGSARDRHPSQLAAGSGHGAARTRSSRRHGFGRVERSGNHADFLAMWQFRLRHSYQALRLRQPESSLR